MTQKELIYDWDNCPNFDFIKDINKVVWWNEDKICLKR
jgi:hypothetical protein